jgi:AcrR family transcriptional regulator
MVDHSSVDAIAPSGELDDGTVLDQTARLLAAEGDGLTMERLAAATGLSRATLYRRFGSRASILQRLIHERGGSAAELIAPDMHTRILQAARIVFARAGFAAATVEQIAQEAGVGAATIYRRFGSKEGVVEAFVRNSSPRRLLRELVDGRSGGLEENLTTFATAALRFIYDDRDILWLAMQNSASSGALREQIGTIQGRTATMLSDYFAQQMTAGVIHPGDPFELALAFVGILFGQAFIGPHFYERPLGDPEYVARTAVHLFLTGCVISAKATEAMP